MVTTSASHPPGFPMIAIEMLRQLLADLPDDWQMSIEDHALVLLFDADDQPCGSIQIVDGDLLRHAIAADADLP